MDRMKDYLEENYEELEELERFVINSLNAKNTLIVETPEEQNEEILIQE